jgi:heat-inducible transcriptional repressor
MYSELNEREKIILRYIIEDFIRTATPVGSRYISKKTDINLSPATIRNVMSDLEGLSFLTHPHTSGGRVPTDKGYRYFIDQLMEIEPLRPTDKTKIKKQLEETDLSGEEIFKEVSDILGKLTREISIVSQPYLSEGIFEKLELMDLSSSKLLVVVSIQSGFVRTLIFDIESEIKRDKLDKITRILNEKLGGLSLKEIRKTYKDRIGHLKNEDTGIVKIFIDSIDKIFQDEKEGVTLYVGGTIEILSQPEFDNTNNYKNIIEFANDRNVVFHVLNTLPQEEEGVAVSIGGENKDEKLKNFSVVCTTYKTGDVSGKIALIGPKRMDYSKMISLLDYTSKILTEKT